MTDRVLIVGLGNPGVRYAATRHNVGYLVVDRIAAELGVGFAEVHRLYQGVDCRYHGRDLALMKPLTYMNRSGAAVLAWLAGRDPRPPRQVPGRTLLRPASRESWWSAMI